MATAPAGGAAMLAGEASAGPPGDWSSDPFASDPIVMLLEDVEERRKMVLFKKALEGPLDMENEDARGMYNDPRCLLRYLRARKWDLQQAEEMIRNTARWRKTFNWRGVREGLYSGMVAELNVQSTMYVRGFNRKGNPALYVFIRNELSSNYEAIVRHTVYNLDRAVACLDRQFEEGTSPLSPVHHHAGKLVLLLAFRDAGLRNLLPLSVVREIVCILQNHYPERLGAAFMFDVPWLCNSLLVTVRDRMLDAVTKEKFHFVRELGQERRDRMSSYFDLAQLEEEMGGTGDAPPFESCIYLGTKQSDTEFGLDYNEQLRIAEAESAKAKTFCGPRQAMFWSVSSDTRTLSLPKRERALVRELVRSLSLSVDSSLEEPEGLYDNAGSLIRYLTSQEWDLATAVEKIRATGRWRKDFGLSHLRRGLYAEALAREGASGKMYVRGFDRADRPIIYFKLHNRDSGNHEGTLRYFVYCLERAIACLEGAASRKIQRFPLKDEDSWDKQPGGKFTLVVDFTGYSRLNRPSLKTLRAAMAILQDHYPERLGQAYLMWPPLKITAFWKAVRRMVDPATYRKFIVVKDAKFHVQLLSTVFDKAALERCAGGEAEGAFDSTVFLSKQVNGEVYGSEFNAQLRASSGTRGPYHALPRRVSFANEVDLHAKENESSVPWYVCN